MIDKKPISMRNIDQDHKEGHHGIDEISFCPDQFNKLFDKKNNDLIRLSVTTWTGERVTTRIHVKEFVAKLLNQSTLEERKRLTTYIEAYQLNNPKDFDIETDYEIQDADSDYPDWEEEEDGK